MLGSILNTKYLKYYFKYFPCICILNTIIEIIKPIYIVYLYSYDIYVAALPLTMTKVGVVDKKFSRQASNLYNYICKYSV